MSEKNYLNLIRKRQSLASKRVIKLKKNATDAELLFKSRLEKEGIRFMFQKAFIMGNCFCIADFYLPKPARTVIEIDGDYHTTEKQIRRDYIKDKYYESRGFRVIRIKNSEVETFDISMFVL